MSTGLKGCAFTRNAAGPSPPVGNLVVTKRTSGRTLGTACVFQRRNGGKLKTPQQRADERRKEKLDAVKEQVDEGTLVIRKMTAKERKKWGPAKETARQRGGRKRR
jgi:hypothetical protein